MSIRHLLSKKTYQKRSVKLEQITFQNCLNFFLFGDIKMLIIAGFRSLAAFDRLRLISGQTVI
jgi:hypothetical protein